MSELLELAERLEHESKASRELDILIGCAVDLKGDDGFLSFRKSFEVVGMDDMLRMAESHQNIWRTELPRYTASIDAAMTLVPEYGRVHFGPDYAEAGCSGLKCMSTWSKAATPALALCAASLRASDSAGVR